MARWLMKSEPDVFGWDDLVARGEAGEEWDGVRSAQATNNMKAMRLGDEVFFYHSNIGKEIVGIMEVSAEAHPDSTADDPKWQCVDVRAVRPLKRPVTLAECKAEIAAFSTISGKYPGLAGQSAPAVTIGPAGRPLFPWLRHWPRAIGLLYA